MSDFALDRDAGAPPPGPRRPNANLGSSDAEEIFMSFDTKILRRFFGFLKPPLALGESRHVAGDSFDGHDVTGAVVDRHASVLGPHDPPVRVYPSKRDARLKMRWMVPGLCDQRPVVFVHRL